MKKVLFIFCALVLSFLSCAHASEVSTLYEALVPVKSQSDQDRVAGEAKGLLQVLTRLTGDQEIAKNETIAKGLQSAESYVQEYGYVSQDDDEDAIQLKLKFSTRDVNRLLKNAGIAYWGKNRPTILVWAALKEKNKEAEIISNESQDDWAATIKRQGFMVGLPFIFPVMDVNDVKQIAASDLQPPAMPIIKEASKRYAPDAMLIGDITANDHRFMSQWLLVAANNQWNWTISGASLHEIAMAVSYQISRTLAQQYAAKPAVSIPENWIKLQITNLTEQNDLADAIKYLKQIAQVKQVQLSEVDGQIADVSVLVQGDIDQFLENAAIGQQLIFQQEEDNEVFRYEWVHS